MPNNTIYSDLGNKAKYDKYEPNRYVCENSSLWPSKTNKNVKPKRRTQNHLPGQLAMAFCVLHCSVWACSLPFCAVLAKQSDCFFPVPQMEFKYISDGTPSDFNPFSDRPAGNIKANWL